VNSQSTALKARILTITLLMQLKGIENMLFISKCFTYSIFDILFNQHGKSLLRFTSIFSLNKK